MNDVLREEDLYSLEEQNQKLGNVYNLEDLMIEPKVIEDVPNFPSGYYPTDLNEFCRYAQESLNVHNEFIKNSMLAVFAHAIGTKSTIEIKKGWQEPAIVWTCNVGHPSSKKSPATNLATEPTEKMELEEDEKYNLLMEEYEDELVRYEKELQEYKNKKGGEKPIEPVKPIRKEFIIKDATIEKVIELVATNDILNIQDEFAGWLAGMDMYKGGKGNERQKWLTAWNGKGMKSSRRGTDGNIKTGERTNINITGAIQPDRLAETLKQNNDGLVERILFSFPAPIKREWSEVEIPLSLFNYYRDLVVKLHDLTNRYKKDPLILTFTEKGRSQFTNIMKECILSVMNDPNVTQEVKSLYGKLEGYFGRFCLIKYWIDVANGDCEHTGEVNEIQVLYAWSLVAYYSAHAKKAHTLIGSDEEEQSLQKIILKIKDDCNGFITPRDLSRSFNWIKNTIQAREWIDKLINSGYGFEDVDGRKKGIRLF